MSEVLDQSIGGPLGCRIVLIVDGQQVIVQADLGVSDDATAPGASVRGSAALPGGVRATVSARWTPRAAPVGGWDCLLTVETDAVCELFVRIETSIPATDPWWLVPGVFYGENRPVDCARRFPRFEIGADDPAGMVSDHWSFRADRAATPAVFAWGDAVPEGAGGVALVTAETSPLGLSGLGLAHDFASGVATVHLVFPFSEAPVTYYGSAEPRPATGVPARIEPETPVELRFAAHTLAQDRHAYAPILREVHSENVGSHPITPWVDLETAAALTAEGLHTWHYDPDPGVLLETVGFDREIAVAGGPVDRQAMHVGWVSGIPWAYALLAHGRRTGTAEYVDAAERVVDFICSELSPSGTFWGTWYREHGWTGSWTEVRDGLHARTLGEATLFLVRALVLESAHGVDHATWRAVVSSNLRALLVRQRSDGNLGAVHDARSGEVVQWTGAAGLTWVAVFVEAAAAADGGLDLLPSSHDATLLRAAAARAGQYYAQFVDREFIHGAPEDVDLAPTSEDGYAAVMAYVALHRATGQDRWLDLARRSADWMLTFRYTYNVNFGEHTILGHYGFASRGSDQASPSNQHLHAYGLVCTAELVELSTALADPHYAERALETLACFRQMVARQDGDFNAYRGMVTERYYQTACFQPKGMMLTLSHAWSVGVLLLACEQELARVEALRGCQESDYCRGRNCQPVTERVTTYDLV